MAVLEKNAKLLWARSAGYCAFRDCDKFLCGVNAEKQHFIIGEMAHIRGNKLESNRHDERMGDNARDSYENLILLCPNHHTLIDKPESEEKYTVEVLLGMKEEHEKKIQEKLTAPKLASKADVAKHVILMIVENYQIFMNYGPRSEIARKNPMSRDAHYTWLIERASRLLPNNQKILKAVEGHASFFSPAEHEVLAAFATHVRGYERWVNDEVSYEGVLRFPQEFETMMKELANAGGE